MALPQPKHMIEADYLTFEQASELRHEYIDGQIVAMTGDSDAHNAIIVSTSFALYGQLRERPCRVFTGSMRVRVSQTGLCAYPDLAVPGGGCDHAPTRMCYCNAS